MSQKETCVSILFLAALSRKGKQTQFIHPNTDNVNTGKGNGTITRSVE